MHQRPAWLASLRDATLPSRRWAIEWPAMPAPRRRYLLVAVGLVLALLVAVLVAGALRPPPYRAPSWTVTGSLTTARSGHIATLLLDGRVLVAEQRRLAG